MDIEKIEEIVRDEFKKACPQMAISVQVEEKHFGTAVRVKTIFQTDVGIPEHDANNEDYLRYRSRDAARDLAEFLFETSAPGVSPAFMLTVSAPLSGWVDDCVKRGINHHSGVASECR